MALLITSRNAKERRVKSKTFSHNKILQKILQSHKKTLPLRSVF